MKFRKNFSKAKKYLSDEKIFFVLWPRQVWKTSLIKKLFENLDSDKKFFINLEDRSKHKFFKTPDDFLKFVDYKKNWEKFFLFIDEFQLLDWIDWKLKTLFDDYKNLKIIASGSNNISINEKIKESFAGRKRILNIFQLDFDEFLIWKFCDFSDEISEEEKILSWLIDFKKNPLNQDKIISGLEDFLKFWSYPEITLSNSKEEKNEIFEWLFWNWFNKDIFWEIKKDVNFHNFLEQLSFKNSQILNFADLAKTSQISIHTVKNYLLLLEQTFIWFQIRPFFTNKLKELTKSPKFYFLDNWFRNFLIKRFNFSPEEFWWLFEWFIFSEMIKSWINNFDIKYWRTSNWMNEVDFVLEIYKKIFEVKYKNEIKKSDEKWIRNFLKNYWDFSWEILNKGNFSKEIFIEKMKKIIYTVHE